MIKSISFGKSKLPFEYVLTSVAKLAEADKAANSLLLIISRVCISDCSLSEQNLK